MKLRARRVVLTRPAERQVRLSQRLESLGCEVLSLPALAIKPTDVAWCQPENLPGAFDVVVFVSRAAWQHYLATILEKDPEFFWPVTTVVATVGQSTAEHARQWLDGRVPVICPDAAAAQDSESLWVALEAFVSPGARVLVVRGEHGREWLVKRLRSQGCKVQTLSVYRREPAVWSGEARERLCAWLTDGAGVGVWLITSLEGLRAVDEQLKRHQIQSLVPVAVAVVHRRLIAPVRQWLLTHSEQGAGVPISVCLPDEASLLEGLLCLTDGL